MQFKICGKNPCYERNGRVFALCASCIWKALQELLDLPDPRSPTLRAPVQSGEENVEKVMREHVKLFVDMERDNPRSGG